MPTTKKLTTGEQAADAVAGGPVGVAVGGPIGAAQGHAANYSCHEHKFKSLYESGPYKEIVPWKDASTSYKHGFEGFDQAGGKPYEEAVTHLRSSYKGKGKFDDVELMIKSAYTHRLMADGAELTTGKAAVASPGTYAKGVAEQVVPVIEEEPKVGKRTVDKGGVKVKTTVTETPVEEDIHLHEEKVVVERRPTNRKVTAADAAFREGTIELRETAEEAVVAKAARVVEEVVIKKQGGDKTQKVRDTVN